MTRTDHMGIKQVYTIDWLWNSPWTVNQKRCGWFFWKSNIEVQGTDIYKEMSNKLALESIWGNIVVLFFTRDILLHFTRHLKWTQTLDYHCTDLYRWILHLYWLPAVAPSSSWSAVANRNTHHEDISLICCLCQQHPVIYNHEKCAGSFSASLRQTVTLNAS